MKFLVLALALVAVASALPANRPTAQSDDYKQIEQIIAAINSPSTDPATAVALEALLMELLGASIQPVVTLPETVVTPVIVAPQPVVTLPAPAPGSPVEIIDASPVAVAPVESSSSSPMVQIILNINTAFASSPAAPSPVPEPIGVTPVIVAPVNPEQIDLMPVVDPVNPGHIDVMPVVDPINPGFIDVMPVVNPINPGFIDVMPVVNPVPETVAVGTLPSPAVNLPEILN